MKIALFTDTYRPQMNGVVAYLEDAIGLLRRKHEVVLFAPGGKEFRTEEAAPNFRIHWIPSSPFPFYEGYRVASMDYRRVSGLLRREKPDVVHAHAPINLGLQGLVSARRKKIPTMVTYHTHFPDYVPHLLNGRLPGILSGISQMTVRKMIKHVFRRADVVAAPTRELVDELRSYGLDNVVHLQNGIDLGKLRCTREESAAFRRNLGEQGGKKILLYLGRVSFEKRIDRLLEAFSLAEKGDRALVIAGGGPGLEDLRRQAAGLGIKNVVFTGFVENKAAAYGCADVFVSASDSETFGLTFVEAMHMGLPVIGVRRLGAKEVIRDGKNGLLVEPDEPEALARAMDRLLSDKRMRSRLGAEGRKSSERYSIDRSVRRTLRIYGKLVRRG